jgi:signal transduction histidine kinase
MVDARHRRPESLLESYCAQLGTVLERRYPGIALMAAKQRAENAATLANARMLEATAADRAKSRFLANMSHELRTPLNAIIGFSEIIKLDCIQPKERYPEYAEYIHDAGKLLLEIINGLLDLARIEAGKLDIEAEIVPIGAIIAASLRTIAPLAEKKSIELSCDLDCDLGTSSPLVWVDPTKFKQIFINLFSNAVKFTPAGGRVTIVYGLDASGDMLIRIADNGIGIAPEHQQTVLQPFEQVEDPLTRQNDGTGLGLPIARALIELHGGQLILNSRVGVGTTVSLRLPRERIRSTPVSAH